jgi:hypothetical protein
LFASEAAVEIIAWNGENGKFWGWRMENGTWSLDKAASTKGDFA